MKGRGRLLQTLPFSDRDRRAIDETIADWETERRDTSSRLGRAIVDLRGGFAVLTVLTLVAIGEVRERSAWSTVTVAALLAAGFSLLLSLDFSLTLFRINGLAPGSTALPPLSVAALSAMLIPSGLGVLLAPMLAVVPLRPRTVPMFGTMICGVLVQLLVIGFVAPWANEEFRQRFTDLNRSSVEQPAPAVRMARGMTELSMPELLAAAWAENGPPFPARRFVLDRATFVAWAPACLVLGVAIRRRTQTSRIARWAPTVAMGSLLAVMAATAWLGRTLDLANPLSGLLLVAATVAAASAFGFARQRRNPA